MASSTATARASDGDPEEPGQRADRELVELLNELRVALPGVQVLFAFLFGIRFTQRYAQLDASDRRVFFGEMYPGRLPRVVARDWPPIRGDLVRAALVLPTRAHATAP